MTALIIDDEPSGRDILEFLLNENFPDIELVGKASNLIEGKEILINEKPSLVFLDIEIGSQTVFELLNDIDVINFQIIFVTAHENYAIQAIKFMAIDYIVKPIDESLFVEAVKRAQKNISKYYSNIMLKGLMENFQKHESDQQKIALITSSGYELIYVRDILYCEAQGSYTTFYLNSSEKRLVSRNLKYYQELLLPYNFYRVHSSFLLNLKKVKKILHMDGGTVEMENGAKFPISRNKKKELLEKLKI